MLVQLDPEDLMVHQVQLVRLGHPDSMDNLEQQVNYFLQCIISQVLERHHYTLCGIGGRLCQHCKVLALTVASRSLRPSE